MHRFIFFVLCLATTTAQLAAGAEPLAGSTRYPVTRTTNQVDVYHGVSVPDPYRWLEDDNSPETKAWVEAQNKVTFDYLGKIPQRDAIRQRLTKLWNYERYGVPLLFLQERRPAKSKRPLHRSVARRAARRPA